MAACKGCGREVLFMKDENGKTQILDAVAPTYVVVGPDRCERTGKDIPERVLVSHFATCRQADRFSAANKKPKAGDMTVVSETVGKEITEDFLP